MHWDQAMRRQRLRHSILFFGVTIVLAACCLLRDRFSTGRQPARPAPPLSDQPLEVVLPTNQGELYWGLFPAFGDLDGDGQSDLMVGTATGRMRFYRNIGNSRRPEFSAAVWFDELCPAGRIPTGCKGSRFRPQFADVDRDGHVDLVTGSDNCCDYEPGFYWFRRGSDDHFTAMPKVKVKLNGVDRPIG